MGYGFSARRNSDNAQVAHIWAQQTESKGEAKGRNVFFEGATIYSYGYHFPMATIMQRKDGTRLTVVNNDSYSSTTSTHQGYVRQAIHGNAVYCSTEQLKGIIHINECSGEDKQAVKRYWKRFADDIGADVIEHINAKLKEAAGKKQARSKAKVLGEAEMYFRTAFTLLDNLGINMPVKAVNRFKALKEDSNALMVKYAKELAAAKKKREKEQAAYNAEQTILAKQAIELWLNNEHLDYKMQRAMEHNAAYVYMRVNGDVIETTKGAKFPVADAIKVFPIIERIKGRFFDISNVKDDALTLGNFKIDNIDKHGNVKAACHFVEYPQIERVAKQLGLT